MKNLIEFIIESEKDLPRIFFPNVVESKTIDSSIQDTRYIFGNCVAIKIGVFISLARFFSFKKKNFIPIISSRLVFIFPYVLKKIYV